MISNENANSNLQATLHDVSLNIEAINKLFNKVHFSILENDDHISSVLSSWALAKNASSSLRHAENLEASLQKLTEMHKNL